MGGGEEEEMKLLAPLLVTGYPTIPIRAQAQSFVPLPNRSSVNSWRLRSEAIPVASFQTDSRKQSALRGFTRSYNS